MFARLVSSSPSVLCRTRPGSLVLVSRYSSGMASYSRWISSMLVWKAGAGRAGWNTCSRAATALLAADTVAASSSETAAARARASAESSSSSRRSVSSS